MYWRMGASVVAFNKYRKSLEEKLWAMGSGPFLVLRQLAESSVDFETHRFERTAQRVNKMIGDWLPQS